MNRFDASRYRPVRSPAMTERLWPGRELAKAPRWASVDLRDGNQALLEPMTVEQKKHLWALLVKVGFKEIEVGFPAASQPDFDFVRWLVNSGAIPAGVTIQVLVQAREDLIARTFEALAGVPRAIVHVYNSTSPVQRERVFGLDRQGIMGIAVQGARWVAREASQYPQTAWTFQYSPESFSNTETDYAVEVCNAVIGEWQPTPEKPCIINLPTTVEVSTPNVFADQVEYVSRHIDRRDAVILSVHTHNDRGGAVASAELALLAGAQRVEGTMLGNGERTGNMDIVTLAMNLYSQGIDPQLDLSNPDEIIQVVAECTGMPLHPRHPWIGEMVYTAFSGSHQDAIRKCLNKQQDEEPWSVAYLPIDPKDIGRDYQDVIRVNSQSGKGGVAFVMERDHGISLPRWMQVELSRHVQKASESAGGVIDSGKIFSIFRQSFLAEDDQARINSYQLAKENGSDHVQALISMRGDSIEVRGTGNGALSAFVNALCAHKGKTISIVDFSESALAAGSDAEAICFVQLSVDGCRRSAAAIDKDTLAASMSAVIRATI